MRLEPLLEQVLDLVGQAQEHVARRPRPGLGGGLEDALELGVVQGRDHGRRHHADRDPGSAEPADRLQPPLGCGRPRLHASGKPAVEGGHRHEDLGQAPLGHRRQDVDVAQHQGGLGDDPHRVGAGGQHLEDLAGDAEPALDRLVRVGVGAQRDDPAAVFRVAELPLQDPGGVGLGEQAGLEVQPGREPQIGVARAGVTVDAAVFAPPVGIDRAVEGDVR